MCVHLLKSDGKSVKRANMGPCIGRTVDPNHKNTPKRIKSRQSVYPSALELLLVPKLYQHVETKYQHVETKKNKKNKPNKQIDRVRVVVAAADQGSYGDFVNLKMIYRLSLSEELIKIKCACVRSYE